MCMVFKNICYTENHFQEWQAVLVKLICSCLSALESWVCCRDSDWRNLHTMTLVWKQDSPGWYKRRKDPTGARLTFMLLGWLHAFLVMITVEQLIQKRGGVHTSRSFIACCVVRKLRPQLGHTPSLFLCSIWMCRKILSSWLPGFRISGQICILCNKLVSSKNAFPYPTC